MGVCGFVGVCVGLCVWEYGVSGWERKGRCHPERSEESVCHLAEGGDSSLESNFVAAAAGARARWLAHGFRAGETDAITDEAAAAAWHTMNSMCAGPAGDLNRPPVLTALHSVTNGLDAAFSCDGYDPEGFQVTTNWDFGDGAGSNDAFPGVRMD